MFGTLMSIIVAGFIVVFVVLYQKKVVGHKLDLEKIEVLRQHQLLKSIIDSQEKERKLLSENLHDSVGSSLSAINLYLNQSLRYIENDIEAGKHIESSKSILKTMVQEVRSISKNLSPAVLLKKGLSRTVADFTARLNESSEFNIEFLSINYPKLSPEIELHLYRIIQEVVNNSVKHSKANNISIKLETTPEGIVLEITDNGCGFDLKSANEVFSLGFQNIKSRAQILNATYTFNSVIGQGTTFKLTLSV